jgi:ArsR family transcriptional regulator
MSNAKSLFELHADVCKTLANPKRLEILNLLRDGELNVSELVTRTGLQKANISQHLSVMRSQGILETRREGLNVFYKISNPKVTKACDLMREVLLQHISRNHTILKNS